VKGGGCRVEGFWVKCLEFQNLGLMVEGLGYSGTSLIRKRLPLGHYSRHMSRALHMYGGPGGVIVPYERGTPV